MIELLLALLLQIISPTTKDNTGNAQKEKDSEATTQSVSTQSTTTTTGTTTQYDGGHNHWETKD